MIHGWVEILTDTISSASTGMPACSKCVNVYFQGTFVRMDVFEDIPPLCELFTNSEIVMSKLVLNIYHGKLQVSGKYADKLKCYKLNFYSSYTLAMLTVKMKILQLIYMSKFYF